MIVRRNEFQDKFFLVHSTCRWRDCTFASVVGSFSILFTFSRQRENIRPSHFAIREYSSQCYTQCRAEYQAADRFLFDSTDIQDLPMSLITHGPSFHSMLSFDLIVRTQIVRSPHSRNAVQWILRFQFLIRYKAANFPLFRIIACTFSV